MKRTIFLLMLLISVNAIGQITAASYTNKGATVPFINSSSYKLNGVTLDSANTVKRGFFTNFQYNKLQALSIDSANTVRKGLFTPFQYNKLDYAYNFTLTGWQNGNTGLYYQQSYIAIGNDSASYTLDVTGDIRATGNIIVGQRLIHEIYEVAAYTHPDSVITTAATTDWKFLGVGDNNKFSNIYAEGFTLDGDTLVFNQEAYDLRDSVEFNINYSCVTATSNVNKSVFYGIFTKHVGGTYKEWMPVTSQVRTASSGVYYAGAICTTMPIWLKDGDKIQIRIKVGATTSTVSTENFKTYLKEE